MSERTCKMSDQSAFTSRIPHGLLKSSMNVYEKAVLLYLSTFKRGYCFPSHKKISKDLGISVRQVIISIGKLKTNKYLTVFKNKKEKTVETKSNQYASRLTRSVCTMCANNLDKKELTLGVCTTCTDKYAQHAPLIVHNVHTNISNLISKKINGGQPGNKGQEKTGIGPLGGHAKDKSKQEGGGYEFDSLIYSFTNKKKMRREYLEASKQGEMISKHIGEILARI